MDYFSILNLKKEPFSNSPDPEFFFQSWQHLACLQKLELSVRLRRGLNVVIGDVGTGKTTLCRQIIRRFAAEEATETHLILDPNFNNPHEFLNTFAEMLGAAELASNADERRIKELIKQYLFRKGVDEDKRVVLIIDEGQKIPLFCLEILREFLNYETNEYKLLQIVIFAQKEFQHILKEHANFADRINIRLFLGPLSFRESRLMIKFRLDKAASGGNKISVMFSYPALWAIYRATGGYPRKIINLCHQIILTLIIQNRFRVSRSLVRACAKRIPHEQSRRWQWAAAAALSCLIAAVLILNPKPERLKADIPTNLSASNSVRPLVPQPHLLAGATHLAAHESVNKVKPEVFAEAKNFPEVLGQIRVNSGETVLAIVYKVYGLPDSDCLDRILSSLAPLNPEIKDLNGIVVGDVINFPAVPAQDNPLAIGWWVQLAMKDTLEEAYEFTRLYADSAFSLRMLPYRNSREGRKFAVLLRNCFANEESARDSLDMLPAVLFSGAKIVTGWDDDTLFFSNVPKRKYSTNLKDKI
ncbi:MAG TPA: AAA family ATPase [Anaerolineae bacterium]|nr:AAA family ATPase [Anaerolineae bacterium]